MLSPYSEKPSPNLSRNMHSPLLIGYAYKPSNLNPFVDEGKSEYN